MERGAQPIAVWVGCDDSHVRGLKELARPQLGSQRRQASTVMLRFKCWRLSTARGSIRTRNDARGIYMDTLGHQFLGAFADIEKSISLALGRRGRFMDLARDYVETQNLPPSYLGTLQTFATLRNAIDHNSHHGAYPIAEPIPDVVDEIRRMRELIKRPPEAMAILGEMKVCTVRRDDPISSALEHVRQFDLSQFPVYESGEYAGILTTNAISRWLAQEIVGGREHRDAPICEVMEFCEPTDRALLVDQSLTAADAIHLLANGSPQGGPVNVLIVTATGSRTDPPLRVIAIFDLPILSTALKFN
jgi:hypothetical protein